MHRVKQFPTWLLAVPGFPGAPCSLADKAKHIRFASHIGFPCD